MLDASWDPNVEGLHVNPSCPHNPCYPLPPPPPSCLIIVILARVSTGFASALERQLLLRARLP